MSSRRYSSAPSTKWRRTGSSRNGATNLRRWPTRCWTFFLTELTSVKRAVEYMDVHSSTPPRRVLSPDEPATLVDVFTGIARDHKRPDTLNYKSNGRWLSISSDELLARARHIAAGLHAIGVRPGDRVALLS